MKRLKFKQEFKGVGNALKLIPESYKVDNKVFEMTDGVHTLKDAIVLPNGVTMSADKIQAMKQKRFDDWIEIINTPPVEEIVVEELADPVPVVEE